MPKVLVEAQEDFFDRANQVTRVKGSRFDLREEYAKQLGKTVKVVEQKGAPQRSQTALEREQAKAEDKPVKDSDGNSPVEKVKPQPASKASGGPTAKKGK